MTEPEPSTVYDQTALASAVDAGALLPLLKEAQRALDEAGWTDLIAGAAEAHNDGRIDVIAALSTMPDDRLGFAAQLFLERVVPQLAADLPSLVTLHEALTARSQNDGVGYHLLTGFEGWCDADPSRPIVVVDAVRAGTAPDGMLRVALLSGLRHDRARFLPLVIDMVASDTPVERDTATQVLGWFDGFTDPELGSIVACLESALARATGPAVALPLRALLAIAKRAPANDAVGIRALGAISPRSDAVVREAVASELLFSTTKVSEQLAHAVFDILAATEAGETATLDAIDHIVSQNLSGALAPFAHELLDGVLARRAATMKLLDTTAHALLSGDAAVRATTVARWLASDNIVLFVAVRDLCSGFGEDAPRFDLDFSGLSPAVAERIARRCCALLMVFPDTIASILASLLRTGPEAAVPGIERLLFDPLLINYWMGPRTLLESLMPGAPAAMAAALKRVFARHDEYKVGVEAVRDLPELRPSAHHRFLAATKRHDEQRAIAKAAQRQSVFAEIFPTSILLYGDSAVFDMHLEPGKTVRQETRMQSHEFSHELPRVEVIDPFGSWYQREHLLRDEPDE